MKRLFSTPKRAAISLICVVAVITVVSVTAVKSTLITKAEATAVALGDAGLSEAEASALRTRLEFDDGRFQYEVEFYNNGTEYEYLIQAKDGDIIARDIEGGANGDRYGQNLTSAAGDLSAAAGNGSEQPQGSAGESSAAAGNSSEQPQGSAGESSAAAGNGFGQPQGSAGESSAAAGNSSEQPQGSAGESSAAAGNGSAQSQGDTLEEAKAAALRDAGLSEADVTFKKAELDHDKGMQVYDIEFYTSDAEYEYEINASDWSVHEKSVKTFQVQGGQSDNAANSSNGNYIGVDRAKEIALDHAGLSEEDVRFAKAKLENDHGRAEYEIEFYSGRTEYDYSIDAVSGDIIEYDVDFD